MIRYPVTSPDMLGGLSALLMSSVAATPACSDSDGVMLAPMTCGTNMSSAPDDDCLTFTVV